MANYKVHHGGLMRCCLASLDEQAARGTLDDTPHTACEYCRNPMARDAAGVWRWDRDRLRDRESEGR